jgi:hypothetical protein
MWVAMIGSMMPPGRVAEMLIIVRRLNSETPKNKNVV